MATNNKVNNSLGTTAYAVMCGGTTALGNVQPVASVGTAGQVLKSNGAGALPSFQDIPGQGALVQIGATQTASTSANINFTSGIDTTYDTYLVVFNNVVPVTNGSALLLTLSVNGGSSYLATGYQGGINVRVYNSATLINDNSSTFIALSGGQVNTAARGVCGYVYLYGLATANLPKVFSNVQWNNTNVIMQQGVANNSTTSGVNALRFAFNSGNISTGSFTLFGLRK